MALIACPECGKEISDKATACPHCGAPAASKAEKPRNKYDVPAGKKPSSPWPAVIAVAVVGAIAVSYGHLGKESPPREPDYEQDAKMACKREITKRLNDPKSAEFPSADKYVVTEIAPKSSYLVTVDVRAKNGFNALRLMQFKCTIAELTYPPGGGYEWRGTATQMSH